MILSHTLHYIAYAHGLEHRMVGTFFCTHTQEEDGLVVPGMERHAHLFQCHIRLRQLWVFITIKNALLASHARLIIIILVNKNMTNV